VGPDSFDGFGDELTLVVPPYSGFLRAIRLVAADAAVRAGLNVDETEDFRLAVDELCHTLMSATDHPLALWFTSKDGGVVARGSARGRQGSGPIMSALSTTIVEALSDDFDLAQHDGQLEFIVTRRMAASHQ
jgi:serine/threonine-protein kinase RsbW